MKKTYMIPEVVVLNVEVANLCGVSDGSADMYSTKMGGSDALSREGGSSWDDEE